MEQGIYFSGKCCVFFLACVPPLQHRNHFLIAVFTVQGKSWCIHYQGSPGIFFVPFPEMLWMKDIYCQLVSLGMGLCNPAQPVPCLMTPAGSPVLLEKSRGDSRAKTAVTNWNVGAALQSMACPCTHSTPWSLPLEIFTHFCRMLHFRRCTRQRRSSFFLLCS